MTRPPLRRRGVVAVLALAAAGPVLAPVLAAPPAVGAPVRAGEVRAGGARAALPAVTTDEQCSEATPKLIDQRPDALTQLGATLANGIATGSGVTVAVVDSGVAATNVHFPAGSVLPGQDLTGTGTVGTKDTYAHGTAVAGIIGARGVPGSGVVGLAPGVTILPIRVYTQDSESQSQPEPGQVFPTGSLIAQGIQTAAAAGARIINVSMSTLENSPVLSGAVAYATSRGALVIASAGNRPQQTDSSGSTDKDTSPRFPAAYPDVLAVAAADSSGVVTDDSIHGSYIDVSAPGSNIITTFLAADDCEFATDATSTSYAAAYVSAAAALIAQAHPDETPAQWRYRLEATASRPVPGARDDDEGWGYIQPYEALTFVSDGSAAGPPDPVATGSTTPSAVASTVAPLQAQVVDHTTRNQTLWLGLGGVVAVLALALVALLRRDRTPRRAGPPDPPAANPPAGGPPPSSPPSSRPPAGVR